MLFMSYFPFLHSTFVSVSLSINNDMQFYTLQNCSLFVYYTWNSKFKYEVDHIIKSKQYLFVRDTATKYQWQEILVECSVLP